MCEVAAGEVMRIGVIGGGSFGTALGKLPMPEVFKDDSRRFQGSARGGLRFREPDGYSDGMRGWRNACSFL